MVALKLITLNQIGIVFIGSRNAVVALKRIWVETPLSRCEPKQERRGGIETRIRAGIQKGADQEAGTPWWH